jgi:hypothetical protein
MLRVSRAARVGVPARVVLRSRSALASSRGEASSW